MLSREDILKEKKKILSHCVNLECQKEQLLILIEKLYKISGQRMNFLSEDRQMISQYVTNTGSYLFSIGDQLKKAKNNRKEIEKELQNAKNQIKELDGILKEKQQG